MTLSTTTSRVSFAGDSVSNIFAFSFKIWAASNLKVYLRNNSTLVDTLQTLTTHYSVDIVTYPNTGNVVFVAPPAAGNTVVIVRDMPLTQELDLIASGAFAAENVEVQLDKLAGEIQTLRDMLGRSLVMTQAASLVDLVLPEPKSTTANQLLGINSGGTAYELKTPVSLSLTTVSAFMATLLDDSTQAVAQATLGVVGKQTIWVPAGSMTRRTTLPPAVGTVETTTNKVMISTLDFDAAADEFAQFSVQMPKGWDEGTVTALFVWSHAATATNFAVVWGIQGLAVSDDDALDTAFGTAVTVTDTGGTTNDLYRSPETGAVTIGNTPVESDVVIFQVYRDADAAPDNLAIDARLHGIALFLTTNAATDN